MRLAPTSTAEEAALDSVGGGLSVLGLSSPLAADAQIAFVDGLGLAMLIAAATAAAAGFVLWRAPSEARTARREGRARAPAGGRSGGPVLR